MSDKQRIAEWLQTHNTNVFDEFDETNLHPLWRSHARRISCLQPAIVAAGKLPESVAIDPSGKFAYAVNATSNDVWMYSIDTATGNLLSIGTIAVGSGPNSIAIDPSGKFAYVANRNSDDISMYTIDSTTGALMLIGSLSR